MKNSFIYLIILILISSFVSAVETITVDDIPQNQAVVYTSNTATRQNNLLFTIVDNKECDTFTSVPSIKQTPAGTVICMSNTKTFPIVAQLWHTSPWSGCGNQYTTYCSCTENYGGDCVNTGSITETQIRPGEEGCFNIKSGQEYQWDIYYCNTNNCNCGAWKEIDCLSCEPGWVQKERTCTPSNCLTESGCYPKTTSSFSLPGCVPQNTDSGSGSVTSGSGTGQTNTQPTGTPPPSIFSTYEQVSIKDGLINVNMGLQNNGGDMANFWLVEMQVRPKNAMPLSFVGQQEACDPNNLNNVHKQYKLNHGEFVNIYMDVKPKPGEYDIWLVSVDKCFSSEPVGNTKTTPFGGGKLIGSINTSNNSTTDALSGSIMFVIILVAAMAFGFLGLRFFGLTGTVIGGMIGITIALILIEVI